MSTTLPDHDPPSSSIPPLDGKRGPRSAAKAGKSTERMGPGYVYYRLYTKLGAFESNHALYHDDRFIGRIPSKSFAPPHTVASIKWSLCKLEGLAEPDKALLFTSLSSPAPKEDTARLSFLVGVSYPNSALIRIVVYYRVYSSEGGDKKSKTSFDKSDISLGRINTLFVAPPHTAGSLKACIAKVEGLATPGHALYKDMELFQDVNSDATMSDVNVISFLGDTYPGSDRGDPIALVNAYGNVFNGTESKITKRVPATTSEVPADTVVEEAPEAAATEEAKPANAELKKDRPKSPGLLSKLLSPFKGDKKSKGSKSPKKEKKKKEAAPAAKELAATEALIIPEVAEPDKNEEPAALAVAFEEIAYIYIPAPQSFGVSVQTLNTSKHARVHKYEVTSPSTR
ncbi:uncharacterized protein LACBIDRAFT_330864 [Laccaria bicolor S238N-H82]|uniref:Predicted protein n=1 Tax=Laccaria bicolor (strain S238N-H82 / ATCC MYA-4686) TaxID=486041 RepID=B0DN03_LACBS|nr:uncharacterized protein LACBIDRAFT_330864 [Laccaria bicolor S238N-H82]EDR03966.1 predicted protein [Laccaria bicolor S238N-H82]|eukprot:XP_001885221.1 predicted protein [Laccaria bicolor S238N-H82]